MGAWGYKIGDSDQALDVFEFVARDKIYMNAMLNRNDMMYYLHSEEILCAIALLDAQFNGIDDRIWSKHITGDKDYMNILKAIQNWTPRYELINSALYSLDLIEKISLDSWVTKELRTKRKEIIDLLRERLQLVNQEIYTFLYNRNNK